MFMWFGGWELLPVWHQTGKFSDHLHSDSGDLILLICQVTSLDPVPKKSCDLIDERTSQQMHARHYCVASGSQGIIVLQVDVWHI